MYRGKNSLSVSWKKQIISGLIGTLGVIVLLATRQAYDGNTKYFFIVANVALAWLAWLAGVGFLSLGRSKKWLPVTILLGAVWIAMLPNTFYVITDFIHVAYGYEKIGDFSGENFVRTPEIVPAMIDIAIVSAAAWTAGLLGVVSLLDVRKFVSNQFGVIVSFILTNCVLLGSAYAIFLGRSPRLNSWDMLTDPAGSIQTISSSFTNADARTDTIVLTLSFFVIISISFWSVAALVSTRSGRRS